MSERLALLSASPWRALGIGLLCFAAAAAPIGHVTVHPMDTGEALLNPGMGWVFHHFDNTIRSYGPPLGDNYAGQDFPGLRVAYLRLAWSYLEPEEGQFNWAVVDSVAQRYIDAGRDVAFRFTCFETEIPFATPEWVKAAGAKGTWWVYGKGCVEHPEDHLDARWEPDYADPIFLARLDRFLAAAAARYDGLPHVAFVDIGSLGVWGEGHPCAKDYPLSVYQTHIVLHFKHFRKTLLVGMDDWQPTRILRARGSYTMAFRVGPVPEFIGVPLQVKAGVWIPGEGGRALPEGRLLPSHALPDRRVLLGTLTTEADGTADFRPAEQPGDTAPPAAAEVTLTPGLLLQRSGRHVLTVSIDVLKDLPEGSSAFCHLSDGPSSVLAGCPQERVRNEALDIARDLGATMRDDSIIYRQGFTFSSEWMAEAFWHTRPVVIESGHYGANDWGDGSDYFAAIEAYHASYVSIHGDPYRIWNDHSDVIPRMNRRMGYRIQLVQATWPETVHTGTSFELQWDWRNAGVAPCLPGGIPAFTLKHGDAIAAVLVDPSLTVRDLAVGDTASVPSRHHVSALTVPATVTPGPHDVYVSVGDPDGTPSLALALANDDGHHRYRIGQITVLVNGEYYLEGAPALVLRGDTWVMPVAFKVHQALPNTVRAFGHLEQDRRIMHGMAFALDPDAMVLSQAGNHPGAFILPAGAALAGQTFSLHVGLWIFEGRRLVSDNGNPDGRVDLGTIAYDMEGIPSFAPP